MRRICQICGHESDAPTCWLCGEASWAHVVTEAPKVAAPVVAPPVAPVVEQPKPQTYPQQNDYSRNRRGRR